jgi:hypothetical protein
MNHSWMFSKPPSLCSLGGESGPQRDPSRLGRGGRGRGAGRWKMIGEQKTKNGRTLPWNIMEYHGI